MELWFRAHTGARVRVPLRPDPRRGPVRVQRHPGRRGAVRGVQHPLVRDRARRPGRAEIPDQQLHRRHPERVPGHGLRHDGGARSPARLEADPDRVRGADLHERDRPRDRDRAGDPGALRHELRRDRDGHRDQAQVRLRHDHRGARAVQHEPGAPARAGEAVGHGPDPRRGERGPVRDAVADLPADHVPAAAAGDRGGVPAVVHVQLRRLRDHDVRVRTGLVHAAPVHLRPGPARA